jgi:hypothetical protein
MDQYDTFTGESSQLQMQSLTSTPQYVPNNSVDFEMCELNFDQTVGDGIRTASV